MRPFNREAPELNEENLIFYSHIGLITVRFAELESILTHIIERLINSDDSIISNSLIEKNNLAANLDLLKKINRRRQYQEEKIDEIISKTNKSRNVRNFFVHGVWSDVKKDFGELYIYCSNHKHIYEKVSDGQQWTRYRSDKFTLNDFQDEIKKIDEILLILKELWEDLHELDSF